MPRNRSDDTSPGDARQPYSDRGGPAARHAETHDVRREELANPKGPQPRDGSFDDDLGIPEGSGVLGGHVDESIPATDDKRVRSKLADRVSPEEMARLTILEPGTDLAQGGVYLDLEDAQRGPFKAIGGQVAERSGRYVAKRDLDHELWAKLADDREPEVERPQGADSSQE